MAAGCYITIDGDLLEDALLVQATVIQELDSHWWCDVEYRQTPDKRFPAEDVLGKDLSVSAPDDQGRTVQLFTGFIVESELEYEIYGSQRAWLRAVSQSYVLDLTPRRAYYFQKTPQQVAQQIMSSAGLSLAGTLHGQQLSFVQLDETDFHFVRRLVDGSEQWMRPSRDGVEVHDSFQSGPAVNWRAEHGLIHFEVQGRLVTPAATGAHYDYRKMQSRVAEHVQDKPAVYDGVPRMFAAAESQSSKFGSAYIGNRDRLLGVNDLDARLKKEARRFLGGSVVCRGISRDLRIEAGNEVTIDGTLDANGTYGVLRVVHSWTANGYENEFVCTPSKRYTNPYPAPAPRFDGIVPARVVDNNDPQEIGRIQVQYYWQEDSHSCWLRWMTPHAGADRGFFSLPEIGDEVWILFEEGDPERARILGAAWNGVQKPPREEFWGGDVSPNDVKRVVTKSGNRISIIDKDGKSSIVLATPNHLKLSMLENSNETGDAMLALHSDGDVFLSAPRGRIHCRSKFLSREVGESGRVAASTAAVSAPAVSTPKPPAPKPPMAPAGPASAPLPPGMTHEQKMLEAIKRAPISDALRQQLGDPKVLVASFVIVGGGLALLAATGFGAAAEVIGAGLLLAGAAVSGWQIGSGLQDLYSFWDLSHCDRAKTVGDLDAAGRKFADGVSKVGVNTLFLLLSIKSAEGRDWLGTKSGTRTPPLGPDAPEPGALPGPKPDVALPEAPELPAGWDSKFDFPTEELGNFGTTPKPIELAPGTKVYRVLGTTTKGIPNTATGPYWSLEPPPPTEGEWRGSNAVKNLWNSDGSYVEYEVGPEGLKAWEGPAAPQGASNGVDHLPGGADQLYVPDSQGQITGPLVEKATPWNDNPSFGATGVAPIGSKATQNSRDQP